MRVGSFIIYLCISFLPDSAIGGDYPKEMQRIFDRGTLIVAMHAEDAPPFFMHDEKGRFYGLDVELARDIGRRLGVKVVFNREAETYDGVVDMIVRREADIAISYLSSTLERSKRVRFTNPYIVSNLALLVNRLMAAKKKRSKKSLSDILKTQGEKIGVLRDSSHIGYVKELFPRVEVKTYKAFDPYIVDAVLNGDCFAGFFDEVEVKRVIKRSPEYLLKLQMVVLKDAEDAIAMAVPWDSLHFLSWLNLYMKTVKLYLTADKLLERYPEIYIK